MFRRLAKLLAVVAAVQMLGGHWMALQSVAWMSMVINYTQQTTLVSALEKTFDGGHPCSLCEAVKEGHGEEQKQQAAKEVRKLDAVLSIAAQLPDRVEEAWTYDNVQGSGESWQTVPPTPPPLA